ncbi:MAG: glucosaminidase domain-containing protein [Sphingobacteriia bacterium]|nr:glucosaminidase domain-containing protein [Sphingobacteriia bacterium]
MKKLILIIGFCCSLKVQAQQGKGYIYINRYKDIAIAEMQRTGVPAAITLAQGILESQYGESELCKKSNNHFGIKCKTEWNGEKTYHDDDVKHECFRVYPNAEASFKDHSDFLKNRPYYTSLFELSPTDVEGWCFGLKKAGYATEKDYPQKLLKIINDYNLSQYNYTANTLTQTGSLTENTSGSSAAAGNQYTQHAIFESANSKKAVIADNSVAIATSGTPANGINNYPDGVFTINHTKVIYAKAGTSLLLLANQFDLPLIKLFEFNDMEDIAVLPADKLIFIEKKLKKGASDFHIVIKGESLYDISQKEGVRLENLLSFNNITRDMQPIPGEKIYLRYSAPVTPKTVNKENAILGGK